MIRMTAGNVSKDGKLVETMGSQSVASEFENLMNPSQAISTDDFEKIKVIGRGAFAKVYLVKKRGTNDYYAMKILKKKQLQE